MTRKEVIDWLCRLRSWIAIYIPRNKQECKQALDFAVKSLETDEAYQLMEEQPKADKPTIIDWNNCHAPEQLDSISTTKNDLRVDCISRQEVLRLLVNSIGKTNTYLQTEVLKMSSVTPQEPRWIPVNKRLPEENGEYLVTVKRGYVVIAFWINAEYWSEVTAWMPLPKAY